MNKDPQARDTQKTAIAPMLSVRNGKKAIEFYKTAFGAGVLFHIEDPSGAVVAQLSVGKAGFWVADESPEHLNFSPESLGGGSVRMVMTVEDPDVAFDRAVAAGAKVVQPVINNYGWRLGRIVDPFGHHWEIGKLCQWRLSSCANCGNLRSALLTHTQCQSSSLGRRQPLWGGGSGAIMNVESAICHRTASAVPVPGSKYGWPRNILHWTGVELCIVDICATVPIHFVIAEAIVAMEANGPLAGTLSPPLVNPELDV